MRDRERKCKRKDKWERKRLSKLERNFWKDLEREREPHNDTGK
jgi:hypothetical protein